MAHKKGERRLRAKYKNIGRELEQMEACNGIRKRSRPYPGCTSKRSIYEVYWNRKMKCDLLTLQKVRRHFIHQNMSMDTWIKAITPMSGSAGGWIVEYDTYDSMCRFESVAYFDADYYHLWSKEVDVDPPLKIGWPGRPPIHVTHTPNSLKNRTYRRAA